MKNTRYYTGKSESVGSFILEGYTHKFENGTLAVYSVGKESIFTKVVAFDITLIKESDSDKIDRLVKNKKDLVIENEKRIDLLNSAHTEKVAELEKKIDLKNRALDEIKELSYIEDIPTFGKSKVFRSIYSVASSARF